MISTVLIADDSYTCRWLVEKQIHTLLPNAQCICVANGLDALEVMHSHPPELLITSIDLRKLSGLTLLKKISQHNSGIPIPKVLIMTYFNREYIKSALSGIENLDFLDKPVLLEQLKGRIAQEDIHG